MRLKHVLGLARSRPMMLTSFMDALLLAMIQHPLLWHIRYRRGASTPSLTLIRQQRQIEGESRALAKGERRTRERNSSLKSSTADNRASEGLRPVDTGDTSRPMFKVERW